MKSNWLRNTLVVLLVLTITLLLQQSGLANGNQVMQEAEDLLLEKNYAAAAKKYELAIVEFEKSQDLDNLLLVNYQLAKCRTHLLDFEGSLKVFEELEDRAKLYGNNQMQAAALDAQISILNHFTRNEETQQKCRDLLAIENVSEDLYSNAYHTLGHIQTLKGKSKEGFEFYSKAYKIDSIRQDSSSLPFLLSQMGNNLRGQGKFSMALNYMLQSISWVPKKDSFKLSELNTDLAIIFGQMGNQSKAREYFSEARKIAEKYNQKSQLNELLYFEGLNLRNLGYPTLAIEKFLKAAQGFKLRKNKEFTFRCFNSLAYGYLALDQLPNAKIYIQKADSIKDHLGRELLEIELLNNYTDLYLKENKWSKAFQYSQKALEELEDANEIGIQSKTYDLANKYYFSIGDFKNAYHYKNKYNLLKDSLNQLQQISLVYEMEGKYQKQRQDLEISALDLLNRKKSIELSRKNRTIAMGSFGMFALAGLGILGFSLFRTKKKAAFELKEKNRIISKSLADKELLLKEIHHRVKNNLQVISSLLSLQSYHIKDDVALSAIHEGRDRVKSMAIIHQNLYQEENLTGIQIKDYFEKLTRSLFNSYNINPGQIELNSNIESLNLDVDTVIPLGLVVNELITNSLKYAFPKGRKGRINIELTEASGVLTLKVEDNGIGFDASNISEENNSFGYQIIQAFQDKLDASLNVDGSDGTIVLFQMKDYKFAS